MGTKPIVAVVATLDTKAPAAAFLRDEIAAWSVETVLIDPGILTNPPIQADITRWQVAQAAGTTLEALIATGKKGVCIATQTEGLCNIVKKMWADGKLDGIVALGGGQGTSIGTAAMRALPVGVPKLMVSTVASGFFQFGSYVGTKDICMMHSVTDILDVNAISRQILRNAANAIAGMALRRVGPTEAERPAIAITQLGMTTPCVMRIKGILEGQGYQLIPFHSNGTGGPSMEDLIEDGKFVGMIDLSVHEITDGIFGGLAGSQNRLSSLTRYKIPAVVSVGGIEYLLAGGEANIPERWRGRHYVVHNAQMCTVMPTVDEVIAATRALIEPVNRAIGPTIVAVPTVGFIDPNQPGREFYFPEGTQAVIDELKKGLKPHVPLVLIDVHINNPIFADAVADITARLIAGESAQSVAARYRVSA